MKRPAYQWYPGDHQRDTALGFCSWDAKALWRDMLDIMHDGEPRGHFTAGGRPITPSELAKRLGLVPRRVTKLLQELEERNVFSRTDGKVIYSRRMVRDEQLSEIRRNAGKLGGNPELMGRHTDKDADKYEVKGLVNQTQGTSDNQKPTPAVAVGSSAVAAASASSNHTSSSPTLRGPQTERLLGRVEDRPSWEAAIAESGARPAQVESASSDYLGNGAAKQPRLSLFKGYLSRAVQASQPRASKAKRAGSGAASVVSDQGSRLHGD